MTNGSDRAGIVNKIENGAMSTVGQGKISLDDIRELREYLESASGQPLKLSTSGRGQVVKMYGVKCELRLRLDSELLAITNIEMPARRRG